MEVHTPTENVLKIIELLSIHNELSVEEIIDNTNIPYTTVYRILRTFLEHKYIEICNKKKYRLTLRFINDIASSRSSFSFLTQFSRASILKLYDQTLESVHLGVLVDTKVLYIDKIDSNHTHLRMFSYIGYQASTHCTGIGKALLAWLDKKILDGIVARIEFKKHTETTISDSKIFMTHLTQIRKKGYSVSNEEHEKNLYCLAVPIFDMRNHPIAAVSVSRPYIQFSKEEKEPFIQLLWNCAQDISKQLGNDNYYDCLKK